MDGESTFQSDEPVEEITASKIVLEIPAGICHSKDVQDQIFSLETWNALSVPLRRKLMLLLPNFGMASDQELEEREETLRRLFKGKTFHFGNPLERFKSKLKAGELSVENDRLNEMLQKIRRRQYIEIEKRHQFNLLQDVLISRKKFFEGRAGQPVRTPMAALKMDKKIMKTVPSLRNKVARRYFKELNMIRKEVGDEEITSDELFPNGIPSEPNEKELNFLQSRYFASLNEKIGSTKRKIKAATSPRPTSKGSKKDVISAIPTESSEIEISGTVANQSENILDSSISDAQASQSVNDKQVVEEAVANIPGMSPQRGNEDIWNDLDLEWTSKSESEDHGTEKCPCFFSLLRDSFKSCDNFSLTLSRLEELTQSWFSREDLSNLKWADQIEDWTKVLPSAIAFLSGSFPSEQPKDFVPFIKFQSVNNSYQWVGSGRDSDVDLGALTQWWLQRRDRCIAIVGTVSQPQSQVSSQKPQAAKKSSNLAMGDQRNKLRQHPGEEEAMKRAVQSILSAESVEKTPTMPPSVPTLRTEHLLPSAPLPLTTRPVTQTVRVMTSTGIKTCQISSPAIQTKQEPGQHQLSQVQTSLIRMPSKSILPKSSFASPSSSHPIPVSPNSSRLNPVVPKAPASSLLSPSTVPKATPPQLASLRPVTPQQRPQVKYQQVQKIVVKDASGNPIQLSQSQLQKVLASGTLKQRVVERPQVSISATEAVKQVLASVAASSPNPPQTLIQRTPTPSVQYISAPAQTASSSQSVLRLVSSSPVRASPPTIRYVQPSASRPTVTTVQQQQTMAVGRPIAVGQRITVGGKQYLLSTSTNTAQGLGTLNQQQPQQIIVRSSDIHRPSASQVIVRRPAPQNVGIEGVRLVRRLPQQQAANQKSVEQSPLHQKTVFHPDN